MAIGNYSELTTEIAAYLARPLSGISGRVDNALAMFEASFNNAESAFLQQTASTITTTNGTALYALPSDCSELVKVSYQGLVEPILLTSYEWMRDNPTSGQGAPERAAPYPGNRVMLWPTPGGAYTLDVTYIRKVPSLTSTATTNWLLTENPQLYLYGTLSFLLDFVQDFERAASIRNTYNMLISDYRMNSARQTLGNSAIMAPEGSLP
jgi:hypothetical protein